ncbi:mutator type transposase [Tanacetum coccineum]
MAGALHRYLAGLTLVDRLGLDYGLHPLQVDVDVLDVAKYVKDYKIIMVYVEHGSIMKNLSKKQPTSSVEASIVVECDDDPFEDLDEILGDYANTGKKITGDEITRKQLVVHVVQKVDVGGDNESEEESDIEGDYTSGSDSDDSDYDPKHDEVFDDDEHIVEDVHVSMNNFSFTADPKHDFSIGVIEVHEDDLDVIDYDSFGSDLDDGIDSERRIQFRELKRIGKQKNKGRNKYYFYLGQQFASKERAYGRFLSDHIIKSLATNPDIHVRAVQDQTQKQFDVGVSKMKAFRAKRNATDKMTGTIVRIDVQQEPNSESMTRTFRRVYVCLGALKQGFRACGREILGLDGCFMSGPWPGQILTAVGVDANNGIYPVAYAIVEAESKASWYWFLKLLGEDLGIEANFNFTFISDRQKPLQVCFQVLNTAKATSVGKFNKKMVELKLFNSDVYDWLMKIPAEQWSRAYFSGKAKCDLLLNNICEVFNRQLVDGRDQPIITCLEYIKEYCKEDLYSSEKKWELIVIPCKHDVAAIYNMSKNLVGVAIPEQWVHASYRLETWAHVYSFKVNPCNGREMWLVVESRIVITPPLYKPQVGKPPKKRKKIHDEIANESCSSGKLSRKGKSVRYGKCGNMGHNRKGCRGQGGATQAGGSSARNVPGQVAGARNVSSQSGGSSQPIASQSIATGARNASSQAAGASQPSAAPSTASQ